MVAERTDPSERSGWRIVIAGTGGQGVLTVSRLLCDVFVERGHHVVSGQLHGMAQRGGSVQSSVIVDAGISPVIASGRADVVLGFEPVETVRAIPLMGSRTVVFLNTTPVIPFSLGQELVLGKGDGKYPDVEELCETARAASGSLHAFEATRLARDAGSVRSLNMVMLGCLLGSGFLPCDAGVFWSDVSGRMPAAFREVNEKAYHLGVEVGASFAVGDGVD